MAGGLTAVVEPNPGGAVNPVTYYYLNGAGQITQVSVQRNGVAQNRTFVWSGSDMTSSTTPEAGTVTYTYDGNHHVLTRMDAKGQKTNYTYDAYERLTEVQHYTPTGAGGALQEQTNQQVNYAYDTNPLDGSYSQYSWGRLTAVTFTEQTGNGNNFAYMYSYNQAGRVTGNRLTAVDSGSNLLTDLKATYAWDNQGRMTNMTYPSGTALAYQYDSMSRLSGITQNGGPIAMAGYTAANQLSTLQYGINTLLFYESRSYNNLMQLTNLTVGGSGSVNMQYNYTAGQNNGRVTSTTDGVLGETVNYTYDMWNRLTNATATNASWGEAYTFDGFGNLTGKTPTAGSAPAMNSPANIANNQTALGIYDANGNPQGNYPPSVPAYVWDVENRLVTTQPVVSQPTNYTYDPWGRRMWKEVPGGLDSNGNVLPTPCEIYFYGATGQKLETYSCINNTDGTFYSTLEGINVYFGRKLLQAKGVWVATDKLGSVRANSNGETFSYFPYGEERTSTADGREKFATYTRDMPGQDYAEQRYYNANMGAFWSPDPGGIKTANPRNPLSWNRYAYTKGNPIGRYDPRGLEDCDPDDDDGCYCDDDPDGDGCTCSDDGSDCDSGGGSDPAPQKPKKPKKWDFTKSYPKQIPCSLNAAQVMTQVESNFAQFGNFSTTGPLGISESVSFSPPAGPLQVGESIPITVVAGPATINTSVTVTAESSTSMTFTTVPGHMFYPANITFSATNAGNGSISFNISIQGDFPNLKSWMEFQAGGSSFENAPLVSKTAVTLSYSAY
jgi:RHS repeat-associated protein